jgi:hypothetical protein
VETLPNYGLANTITGFATLFAGATCLGLCALVRRQPSHWHFAYWMIFLTGIFTVTLHGFGETVTGYGPRWFWAFLDTGSNIIVAWSIALVALADYYDPVSRRTGRVILTLAMLGGLVWHFVDRLPSTDRSYLISLGEWGGFYPGESCLIVLCFTVVGLFAAKRGAIPQRARPILATVCAIFFVGMLLATANNSKIVPPFFAIHALWHVVGAFGFIFLWAFGHVSCEARIHDLATCAPAK